jgi:hypothetical protein
VRKVDSFVFRNFGAGYKEHEILSSTIFLGKLETPLSGCEGTR